MTYPVAAHADHGDPSPPLPAEGVHAVRVLVRLGAKGVGRLIESIRVVGPQLVSVERRAAMLCERLDPAVPLEDLKVLLHGLLMPLQNLRADFNVQPSKLFEVVSGTLTNIDDREWPEADRRAWEELRPQVEALFGEDVFSTEVLARRLVSDRPNRIEGVSITAELLPVFGDSGGRLDALVVANSLRIDYSPSGRSSRTVCFALEPADLELLEKQVRQAKAWNDRLTRPAERPAVPVLKPEPEGGPSGA